MAKIEHSRKAKEASAEQLLKLSTNLLTAFFVSILVLPMSVVVGAAFNNELMENPLNIVLRLFSSWYGFIFIVAECGLYYLVFKARDNGLEIYNELYPDEET